MKKNLTIVHDNEKIIFYDKQYRNIKDLIISILKENKIYLSKEELVEFSEIIDLVYESDLEFRSVVNRVIN